MSNEKINISLTNDQLISIVCSLETQISALRETLHFFEKGSSTFCDIVVKITELDLLITNIHSQIV
jgi:hypothetical protein